MQHSVYLSLGSNIRPLENIPRALRQLSKQVTLLEISSAWLTKAVGTTGPDFVNLAAHLQTEFSVSELKDNILSKIEEDLGRIRTPDKNAPRTIDIDITLFDGNMIDLNLCQLDYIILPLSELLPDYSPRSDCRTLRELAKIAHIGSSAAKLPHFTDYRTIEN